MRALFEILTGFYLPDEPIAEVEDELQLYTSICAHLTRLFNARCGSLSHKPDYGLPNAGAAASFVFAIKQVIEKYEPRLREVKVVEKKLIYSDSILCVEIYAQATNGQAMQFDTYLMNNGVTIE